MKSFLKWLVLLPVAAVLLIFAINNREPVKVVFDPFGTASPGLTAGAPMFVVLLAALMAGVVIGGMVMWLSQGRHRRAARVARGEARNLREEATRLRTQVANLPVPRGDHRDAA